MYEPSRSYAIVPALPVNLTSIKFRDDLTSTDRLVWSALCFHTHWTGNGFGGSEAADNEEDLMTGYCSVDYKTLMIETSIKSKDTLYRSLKKLEESGYIERIYHGPNLNTEYILHAPKETVIKSYSQS